MKHSKISAPELEVRTDREIRAHTPDPHQCAKCELNNEPCSTLAFDTMPVLHVYSDGIAFVDCVQFEKEDA